MIFMRNFAVRNWKQASALGAESNWRVINEVRNSGTKGTTASEISKNLDLPLSSVYASLKVFENLDMIESTREKGKRTRVYRERCWEVAHRFGMNQDFLEDARPEIWEITEKIKPIILGSLEQIVKNPKFQKYLPSDRKCPICSTSHEAYDFFHAITFMAAHYCLHPGEFYEFLRQLDYRSQNH